MPLDFFTIQLSFRLVLVAGVTSLLMAYQWQQWQILRKNSKQKSPAGES